jgi:hypothetical protein
MEGSLKGLYPDGLAGLGSSPQTELRLDSPESLAPYADMVRPNIAAALKRILGHLRWLMWIRGTPLRLRPEVAVPQLLRGRQVRRHIRPGCLVRREGPRACTLRRAQGRSTSARPSPRTHACIAGSRPRGWAATPPRTLSRTARSGGGLSPKFELKYIVVSHDLPEQAVFPLFRLSEERSSRREFRNMRRAARRASSIPRWLSRLRSERSRPTEWQTSTQPCVWC